MLIEVRGVDILNVHGHVSDTMHAGWLAAEHGLPVSLGNTTLGARRPHGGCAARRRVARIFLPELQPPRRGAVQIRDGYAYAPDRPGHGIRLSDRARAEFRCPEAGQETAARILPAPPIPLEMSAA